MYVDRILDIGTGKLQQSNAKDGSEVPLWFSWLLISLYLLP